MVPSVLIVSEELQFLLNCYTAIHRDARIGQIEATTNGEEASRLVQTLRPDAIVFDASAGDSTDSSTIRQLREIAPYATVIVTFRERDQETIHQFIKAAGAAGAIRRDNLSPEVLLRLVRDDEAERVASYSAPA